MTFQDDDAKDLGLSKLRQRKRFLAAHKELAGSISPALTEVASVPSPRSPPTAHPHTPTPDSVSTTEPARGQLGRGRGIAATLPAWHTHPSDPGSRKPLAAAGGGGGGDSVARTGGVRGGGGRKGFGGCENPTCDGEVHAQGWGSAVADAALTSSTTAQPAVGWGSQPATSGSGGGWGSAVADAAQKSSTTAQPAVGWGSQPATRGSGGGWGSAVADAAQKSSTNRSRSGAVLPLAAGSGWGSDAISSQERVAPEGRAQVADSGGARPRPARGQLGRGRGIAATLPAWHTNPADPGSSKLLGAAGGGAGGDSVARTGGVRSGSWATPICNSEVRGQRWGSAVAEAALTSSTNPSRSGAVLATAAGSGWGSDGTSTREPVAPGGRAQSTRSKDDVLPGDWECEKCGIHNFASRTVCRRCDAGFPLAPTGVEMRKNESTSDYGGTRKRSATDVAVTVDLTVDDDPVFPAQVVPQTGSAVRKPGSLVAERRAKRLAREAAAAKGSVANERISTVDPDRDPRRRLGGSSSAAAGSGASPRGTRPDELLEKLDREQPRDE